MGRNKNVNSFTCENKIRNYLQGLHPLCPVSNVWLYTLDSTCDKVGRGNLLIVYYVY